MAGRVSDALTSSGFGVLTVQRTHPTYNARVFFQRLNYPSIAEGTGHEPAISRD
jgi:hypothetical protein